MKTFLNYEEAVEALESYDLEEIERKIGVLQRETLQKNSNPEEKAFIAYDFNKSYKYWVKKLNDYTKRRLKTTMLRKKQCVDERRL